MKRIFLYCRYSPAADILATFSGRGISRFQRWPEAVAEHPVSHASSFYYPYRDPHSYRNSRKTSEALAPVWSHVFGISPSGAYALLLGLLCGYPMGTKITSDLYGCGRINRREAEYLLTFTNHASPVFYFIHI